MSTITTGRSVRMTKHQSPSTKQIQSTNHQYSKRFDQLLLVIGDSSIRNANIANPREPRRFPNRPTADFADYADGTESYDMRPFSIRDIREIRGSPSLGSGYAGLGLFGA